jgi:hypothetical protein
LQFDQQTPSPEFPYEEETPAPPPSVMDSNKAASAPAKSSGKLRKVSHETAVKKPATAKVQEVQSNPSEDAKIEVQAPKKPVPTGALSANYLARLIPKAGDEDATQAAAPAKQSSSRRR